MRGVAAAAVFVAAVAARAASIIPPQSLGELARGSDAVVLGLAGAPHVSQRGALLFTLTTFRVIDAVAGAVAPRDRLTVAAPGGEVGDTGWLVPGSPRFQPGHVYLLFLRERPTGEWSPEVMAYGILERVEGRDGSRLLAPLDESYAIAAFPRPDGVLPEAVGTYQEALLLPHLRAVAARQAEWSPRLALARPEQVPVTVRVQTAPSNCAFMGGGNPYHNARWQVFDGGGSVTMHADSVLDTSIADGGVGELQSALAAWSGIPSTSIDVRYGGTLAYTMTCSGGQDTPGSGVNVVVFNDPCGDVGFNHSSCSGTLGFGGPWFGGTQQFDGTTWATIQSQFVVLGTGVGCLGATNYTYMLGHELGHGLGFNHVQDPYAQMYAYCCNAIDATDVTCAQYLYPGGVPAATPTPTHTPPPGPTPTPTSVASPPPAPTGVVASDGTFSDRVRVTWNPVSGADGYQVWRNATNNLAGAANLGGSSGIVFDDLTAARGATYWFWVRAHDPAGWGPFSNPDSGYASAPAPTPTPTQPVGPPSPPTGVAASDGAYADRVRVVWNAVTGATAYQVWRNTASSTASATFLGVASSTFFDDTAAVSGTTYWYWVRSGNGSTWSDFSAPDAGFAGSKASATPTATTPPPVLAAAFTFAPSWPTVGQAVAFSDGSSGSPGSWTWTFGDGAASQVRSPAHVFAAAGAYTVTLAVTGNGGSSHVSHLLTVSERPRKHLPEH